MKALILAAGKGSRMLPLTQKVPKPLITVHGKPLLEWIILSLPKEINEIHLVVGYLEDQIKNYFGECFDNRKIIYYTQAEAGGTWPAMLLARKSFSDNEKFLLTYADDVYEKESMQELLNHKNALMTAKVQDARRYGVVEVDENNIIQSIEEKPENPKTNIVATGVYVLSSSIFNYTYPEWIQGEKYFTNVYIEYLKNNPTTAVYAKEWVSVATPQDIINAHLSKIFN
jgi:bifunctional UDP-N-acetylglucosamine pyrophosphorylase/glucosamine-1-phosphate N-acetyltransferase